jgi:RNA polymerase sigma-70 factor (ECF subfamily)
MTLRQPDNRPTIHSPPDAELLARARTGDHQAFRMIVERYQQQVAATVIGMLGEGPEADDVGQETFIRFYRALDGFRHESSVGTYLTRIAMNLSLNELKRQGRLRKRFLRSGDSGIPEPSTAAGDAEPDDHAPLVRWGIEQLEPKQRAVVTLRMLQENTTKETAEILGVPQGTVLSRLSRGLKRLEELLRPYIDLS